MDPVIKRSLSHLIVAQKYDGADIALFQLIFTHNFDCCVNDILVGKRHLYAENDSRLEQPVNMVLQTKNGRSIFFGIVATNAFKDPEPVMQGMGKHMDIGFVPGNHFPIHSDFSKRTSLLSSNYQFMDKNRLSLSIIGP
jgi:hypothetical protein